METLIVAATEVSPEIILNPAKNQYSISGWSRPESPSKLYDPVVNWIDKYGANYLNNNAIDFKIDYFNSPSARAFREILEKLDKLYKSGVKVSVNWYFDDESSREEFEYEFTHGLSIPVKFLQKT